MDNNKVVGKIPFSDWDNAFHQFTFVALIICGLIVIGVGSENVYAVLLSQQLPVFIEDPFKARCLSLILPIAAFSLKAATYSMENAVTRMWYRNLIVGATVGFLLAWIYLFAQAYQSGLTNDIDWGTLLEPSTGNFGLTGVQIAVEVFAGATLFLMAGAIWDSYSPDVQHPNPDRESAERALAESRGRLATVREMLKQSKPELEHLKNDREGYIRERVNHGRGFARRSGLIMILFGISSLMPITDVQARDYMVAISPAGDVAAKTELVQQTVEWLTKLEAGDRAYLHDGLSGNYIGEFKVPTRAGYEHPKARVMANREAVGKLMQFAKASVPADWDSHALHLPVLLQSLGQLAAVPEDGALDVVIVGTPVFHDPHMEAFSMRELRYPGEGHLTVSRSLSPFGTRGNESLLKGMRVHWVTLNLPEDDRMRYELRRFYALYIESLGGQLASYDGSLERVLESAQAGRVGHGNAFERNGATKVEMIQLRPIRLTQKSIYEREVSTVPLPSSKWRKAERVELGARWNCDCDVDVYAQPFPGVPVLYYGRTKTPQGIFFKDYQSSNAKEGYETVEFAVPLDLRALKVAVNLYRGNVPKGVTGELRLSVDGQTYALPFTIPASSGNSGADAPKEGFRRGPSKHTVVIDLAKMLGA